MIVHLDGTYAPDLPLSNEPSNEFFLFGIYADDANPLVVTVLDQSFNEL